MFVSASFRPLLLIVKCSFHPTSLTTRACFSRCIGFLMTAMSAHFIHFASPGPSRFSETASRTARRCVLKHDDDQ